MGPRDANPPPAPPPAPAPNSMEVDPTVAPPAPPSEEFEEVPASQSILLNVEQTEPAPVNVSNSNVPEITNACTLNKGNVSEVINTCNPSKDNNCHNITNACQQIDNSSVNATTTACIQSNLSQVNTACNVTGVNSEASSCLSKVHAYELESSVPPKLHVSGGGLSKNVLLVEPASVDDVADVILSESEDAQLVNTPLPISDEGVSPFVIPAQPRPVRPGPAEDSSSSDSSVVSRGRSRRRTGSVSERVLGQSHSRSRSAQHRMPAVALAVPSRTPKS